MRFGRREGISKESRRTNRAEDRLHIAGAQRGKQARGSSNQGSAYLLPRRDQGGKRKGRGEGAAWAAGEGDKHRNKICRDCTQVGTCPFREMAVPPSILKSQLYVIKSFEGENLVKNAK